MDTPIEVTPARPPDRPWATLQAARYAAMQAAFDLIGPQGSARREGIERELAVAGFSLDSWWTDPAGLFALSLARAR